MSEEKPKLELEKSPPRHAFEPILPVDSDLTPLPGMEEERERPKRNGIALVWLLLLGLIAFHVVSNIVWLDQDNHVIRTDEEGHMQIARQYHEALFVTPYDNAVERLIAVADIRPGNPAHPPLLSVLGALMIRLLGYHPDIISATSTVLFALLILGAFLLARRILDPWGALFAAFAVSFTPMVYASSRYFMTDFLTATITVWVIYALLKSELFKHTGWVFFFAVLNGLGILARTNTFLYYLIPSAFIALAGLCVVLCSKQEEGRRWRGFGLILLNSIVTIVVSLGVCSAWYFHHIDTFYTFWTEVHASQGPMAANVMDRITAETAAVAVQVAQAVPQQLPSWFGAITERLTNPGEPWVRYPVYLINNGIFLPTFVLAAIGLLCALVHPRFRGVPAFTVVLWVVGSWVLMTVLFKNSTPRYALPFAGGAAMLAALTVLSPPWRPVRGILMALFAALLLFQYGNLTYKPYGPYKRMVTPLSVDRTAEMRYGKDEGLVLWKDILVFGESFARVSAPVDDNYKDLLFGTMVAKELESQAAGEFANYLRVRVRGMEFDERHYWPSTPDSPNPYGWCAWKPEDFPNRKLRSIGMGDSPQELEGMLGGADYLVFYVLEGEEDLEAQWHAYLGQHGFERLNRFFMPASGGIKARYYCVYGQDNPARDVTRETISELSLLQLYQMLYAWEMLPSLEPALQAYARERFQTLLAAELAPVELNDEVSVIPLGRRRIDDRTVQFDLLFQVRKPMDRDWDILFIGKVGQEEADLARLPESKQLQGYMDWNFAPSPPTTQWREGDYVLLQPRIEVEPMPYYIQVGILSPSGAPNGRAANLGWINFSEE